MNPVYPCTRSLTFRFGSVFGSPTSGSRATPRDTRGHQVVDVVYPTSKNKSPGGLQLHHDRIFDPAPGGVYIYWILQLPDEIALILLSCRRTSFRRTRYVTISANPSTKRAPAHPTAFLLPSLSPASAQHAEIAPRPTRITPCRNPSSRSLLQRQPSPSLRGDARPRDVSARRSFPDHLYPHPVKSRSPKPLSPERPVLA